MKAPLPTEDQVQHAIVTWLERAIDCAVCHVPNGLRTSIFQAARHKKIGMRAGAPDLIVWLPEGQVLAIECKSKAGRLSDAQAWWKEHLTRLGHDYIVARSVDDVIAWFGEA